MAFLNERMKGNVALRLGAQEEGPILDLLKRLWPAVEQELDTRIDELIAKHGNKTVFQKRILFFKLTIKVRDLEKFIRLFIRDELPYSPAEEVSR